jgi:uncharacterized protein
MHLYLREIPEKGRAVFCDEDILAGQLIEECPVIVCPAEDRTYIDQTFLYNYYFLWGEDLCSTAIALGFGSLYNHSYNPNARYETYYEDQLIRFIALSDIPAHSEITVNYNHDPTDQTKVWFDQD